MGLGGGYDREWLAPPDEGGNIQGDEDMYENVVGNHKGPHAGLNVFNPQAGWIYVHERNTTVDRARSRAKGGRFVSADDPEFLGLRYMHDDAPSAIDTTEIYNDLILVAYPEARIRELREAEAAKSQAMMRSGSDDFLGRVTAAEREMDPRGRGTRFAMQDHRLDYVDERSGKMIEEWTPEQGIIDRR